MNLDPFKLTPSIEYFSFLVSEYGLVSLALLLVTFSDFSQEAAQNNTAVIATIAILNKYL